MGLMSNFSPGAQRLGAPASVRVYDRRRHRSWIIYRMCSFMASLVSLAACTSSPAHPKPAAATGYMLPAELSTDRWFLDAKTAAGGSLRIYLDSAGGMYLTKNAVSRLRLTVETEAEGGQTAEMAAFPVLADARIPLPKIQPMPVRADNVMDVSDGMFGAPRFAGHAFSFDYPARTLTLLDHGTPEVAPEHRLAVGFPRDGTGKVYLPYGRIQMTVDGEMLDMLLDTGATVTLTDTARAALGGGPAERATSFITKTVFDRWRAKHPDWRVLEQADKMDGKDVPMIEVPKLVVGGYEVGPVWFAWRPDQAFHEYMAQLMDKPTEGALGGNAYRTLRLSVDWVAGTATFER